MATSVLPLRHDRVPCDQRYDLLVPDDEVETPLLGQWVEKTVIGGLTEDQLHDRLEHFIQDRA